MNKLIIIICILSSIQSISAIDVSEYGIYTGNDVYNMKWTNSTHDASVNTIYSAKLWCSHSAWGQGKKLRLISNGNYIYGTCRIGQAGGFIFPIETVSIGGILYSYNDIGMLDLINCAGGGCCDIQIHVDNRYRSYHFYNPNNQKFLTGSTCGLSKIELYNNENLYDAKILDCSGDNYNLSIVMGTSYKIVFSDGHEYEFICDNDKVYNRDICDYFTINLYDNCANLLQNASVDIYKCADIPAETKLIYQGSDSSIDLLMGIDVNLSDRIDIYIDTTDGTEHRIIYADSTTDNLYHSYINWDMTIHVVDDDTNANIQYANVICTQGCSINLPNQKTAQTQTNGKVVFTGLSNQNMVINVEKSDYAIYSQTINPRSVFDCWSNGGSYKVYLNSTNASDNWNNNTHNDSKDINGEGNTTLPDDAQWGCGVYFKNTNSIIVNQINDSDPYVDLYYWAKMENCTTATLKFQEQLYTTWYDSVVYTILNNSYEYRRILKANFTDYTNGYRGYIYNSTCGCNDIQKLKVVNQTYEQETNYQNLSARCKFQNKLSGNQIDYRSVVNVRIYANSTNATLMGITAYFMNQTTVVASKVLNWADFTTNHGYYIWLPNYEYANGYNYTVNITGYNGYQLDTDEVWTADIVGNSLTIRVKDNHGVGITQATIFVEGWGSQSLTSGTYGVITGLPDGDCQYKATKSGYITSGWDTIILSGADETVTCVLTKQSTESITGYKLKDQEVKAFLIPLLYLLFVLIIVGGVINAAKP